mgnify:CR=1 FL=1|jgi:dextranase
MNTVSIESLQFDKAFFLPGEPARWSVILSSPTGVQGALRVVARVSHLDQLITDIGHEVTLDGTPKQVEFSWSPPASAPRGYGLDVHLETLDGQTLPASASSGFDVLQKWTQMPRYGFLSEFQPGRADAASVMRILADYHVNALQFYDWMYRHEQFLTSDEPYVDLLGRKLSRRVVDDLIAAAHERGIAAMPYTAIYGASIEFCRQHPDWALLRADGQPALFGDNFMAVMDPRPNSPWMRHLLAQFEDVLKNTAFDGIHLDQYGDPKVGYDAAGNSFDLADALAGSIEATRAVVDRLRPGGAVVFNAVGNWPVEKVAAAGEDIVYIEVWPPYSSFTDLHALIASAQKAGNGKPVVLAAYVHPQGSANPEINDAIIFASGGGHIELGEGNGYLADPYFPKYEALSGDQALVLRRYYDFAVRYQNRIGPQTREGTAAWGGKIEIPGYETGGSLSHDKIYPLVRESEGATAISLVNLLGLPGGNWNEPVPAPAEQGPFRFVLEMGGRRVASVEFASPDGRSLSLAPLEFTQANGRLSVELPGLKIWDLVVVRWTD